MNEPAQASIKGPQVVVHVHASTPQVSALVLGKERHWLLVILFTVITLGIYQFFFIYNTFEEVKRFGLVKNPTVSVTSGGAAIGFLFIPLFNIAWVVMLAFKFPGLLTKFNQIIGRQGPSYGYLGLLNLVPIIGGLLVLAITLTKLNDNWREQRTLIVST